MATSGGTGAAMQRTGYTCPSEARWPQPGREGCAPEPDWIRQRLSTREASHIERDSRRRGRHAPDRSALHSARRCRRCQVVRCRGDPRSPCIPGPGNRTDPAVDSTCRQDARHGFQERLLHRTRPGSATWRDGGRCRVPRRRRREGSARGPLSLRSALRFTGSFGVADLLLDTFLAAFASAAQFLLPHITLGGHGSLSELRRSLQTVQIYPVDSDSTRWYQVLARIMRSRAMRT